VTATESGEAVKIYTRKGDGGQTTIWGGRKLSKDEARIEAIGACDECNASIGAALAHGVPAELAGRLQSVQGQLFVVGSELMAPGRTGPGGSLPRLAAGDVAGLEVAIDSIEAELPELRNFILPGGTPGAAELHVARAACRRAERRVTTLSREEGVDPVVAAYLNRLADLLFVAARFANHAAGAGDIVWAGRNQAEHGGQGVAAASHAAP
jgi:cob(I)alamin adenosyltransferase